MPRMVRITRSISNINFCVQQKVQG